MPERAPRAGGALRGHQAQHRRQRERGGEGQQRAARLEARAQLGERDALEAPVGLLRERRGQRRGGVGCGMPREVERVPEPRAHRGEAPLDALEVGLEGGQRPAQPAHRERQRGERTHRDRGGAHPGRDRRQRQDHAGGERQRQQRGGGGGGAQRVARDQRAAQRSVVAGEVSAQRGFGHGDRPRISRPGPGRDGKGSPPAGSSVRERVVHQVQRHAQRRLTLFGGVVVDLFVFQPVPQVAVV